MENSENHPRELFADFGRTSEAVLQQAVPVVADGELQHRLEGPADTGCGGCSHEQVATVDGVQFEEEEDADEAGPDLNAALPDEEFPEEAMPPMHFCLNAFSKSWPPLAPETTRCEITRAIGKRSQWA